ncbi:MAG: tetratricopeptide repeat protein [Candidatus Micrarchaeota archaeon]
MPLAEKHKTEEKEFSPISSIKIYLASLRPQLLKTEGATRIQIELEDEPKEAVKYAKKYNNLIQSIASILKDEFKGKAMTEEQFICTVWGIMKSNLKIEYGANSFGFLYESLDTKKFDCDNSAFLVYDVAKLLSIPGVNLISVPSQPLPEEHIYMDSGHALLKTANFFFETTSGKYFPISKLPSAYPLRQILSEAENQSLTYATCGYAYFRQGELDRTLSSYDKALSLAPNSTSIFIQRSLAYTEKGEYDNAISDSNKALKLNPKSAEAYGNLGTAYFKKDELAKAIRYLDKSLSINRSANALYNRGLIYFKKEDYEKAISDFSEIIRLDSKSKDAYLMRSFCYEALGKNELAKQNHEAIDKLMFKE